MSITIIKMKDFPDAGEMCTDDFSPTLVGTLPVLL